MIFAIKGEGGSRLLIIMPMLNQLQEDLKMMLFTETECKIRFIHVCVSFNCKRKKVGKKKGGEMPLRGGGGGPTLHGKCQKEKN